MGLISLVSFIFSCGLMALLKLLHEWTLLQQKLLLYQLEQFDDYLNLIECCPL